MQALDLAAATMAPPPRPVNNSAPQQHKALSMTFSRASNGTTQSAEADHRFASVRKGMRAKQDRKDVVALREENAELKKQNSTMFSVFPLMLSIVDSLAKENGNVPMKDLQKQAKDLMKPLTGIQKWISGIPETPELGDAGLNVTAATNIIGDGTSGASEHVSVANDDDLSYLEDAEDGNYFCQ
jgi:hypothetical protein